MTIVFVTYMNVRRALPPWPLPTAFHTHRATCTRSGELTVFGVWGVRRKLLARAQQIRGTDVVGSASLAFTVASLGPFLLIIFLGITQLDIVEVVQVRRPHPPLAPLAHPTRTRRGPCVPMAIRIRYATMAERGRRRQQVEPHNTHWGTFVTILLWSTAGFDLVGACAGEVQDPGETFPAAMTFAMGLTLVIDILSVVVGMSLVRDYSSWHDGTFMDVASQVRAPPLPAPSPLSSLSPPHCRP